MVVEVERNRDLSTTDDALCCMNKEPNSTTVQHMPYLSAHYRLIYTHTITRHTQQDEQITETNYDSTN